MSEDDHRKFFANKKPKLVVVDENEDPGMVQQGASERDDRQKARRAARLSELMENTFARGPRVTDASGPDVMRVTFDEFTKLKEDPEFEQLGKYARLLVEYADGRPRATPLRALLEHEMGMYRGRVVVLANNPGDGARTGTIVSMAAPKKKFTVVGEDD